VVEAGLLRDVKVGRELLFVNHEFLDVLTRPCRTRVPSPPTGLQVLGDGEGAREPNCATGRRTCTWAVSPCGVAEGAIPPMAQTSVTS
jgi:hypothetical protein